MEERAVEVEMEDTGFEDITGDVAETEEVPEDDIVEPDPVEDTEQERAGEEEEEEVVEEADEEVVETVEERVEDVEPVDEPVVDEAAALREQNQALLEHIESLSSQVVGNLASGQTIAEEQAKRPTEPVAPAVVETPQTSAEVMNYLENVSIDDLLEDPTKFNAVLNNVAQTSQAAAQQQAVQQVLRTVPELVMGYITRHTAMNKMVDDFYAENPDLANVKQTVAAVANDIHAKNPDLGVDDVFQKSAEQTRKILGLKKQVQVVAKQTKKPAFAKAGGARKPAPAIDPIQQEINALITDDF